MSGPRLTGPQRREQLVGVARDVFAERGYEAATIEEIAERAGVTKPVVYRHFGGKEGIYAVVVDREITRLTDRITAALDTVQPRAAAEAAAATFLGYIDEHAQGFRLLVRDGPVGSEHGSLASVIDVVAARTERLLAAEFDQRGFDPTLAPMYARMLVGAVALVGQWWLEAGSPDRRQVATHVVNLLWNGLKDLDRGVNGDQCPAEGTDRPPLSAPPTSFAPESG